MGCNCRKRQVYELVKPDGTVQEFASEAEARLEAARSGGTVRVRVAQPVR